MANLTDQEKSNGTMVIATKANLKMERYKAKAHTSIITEEPMQGSG